MTSSHSHTENNEWRQMEEKKRHDGSGSRDTLLGKLGLDGGAGGAVASHACDGSERPLAEQLAVVVHLTTCQNKDQAGKRGCVVGLDEKLCYEGYVCTRAVGG
jgi:hypothetical protein